MGLFSFLTGKADEKPQSTGGGSGAGTAVLAADDASLIPEASTPKPQPPSPKPEEGSPPQTPFVAPEVWGTGGLDVGALTAPLPSASGDQPQVGPADPALTAQLQGPIIEVIKTVFDPEIPVDVYELGLIYEIVVDAERRALIWMTLTSPACP